MKETFLKVINFCHNYLLESKEILNYLTEERKISIESINKFNLGLFPNDLRLLFSEIDPKDLRDAGVIRNASSSVFKVQNLLIPITDVYNEYIALAGRTLLTEEERKKRGIAKYRNSIYKKSHHLFGLNFAKNSILEKNIVYVVEGYFDVIMPHQKGMCNVVATCGTFLSSRHIALLSRYTDKIVIILDNEENAQEKANMIVEKKKFAGIEIISKNPLKDEKDIDDYLKFHSVNELLENLK